MTISGTQTQVLPIQESSQVGHARRVAQGLAQAHGLDETDAGRVALLATEMASNLLKHAGHGELHLRALPRPTGFAIELQSVDRAQGFDLDTCLADGFSTGGTQGIGLGALMRMASVFDAYADHRGAVLLARVQRRDDTDADLPFGVVQRALHDAPACGDVWHLTWQGQDFSALVIDGLGHGEEAEQAARAGEQAFAQAPFQAPGRLMDSLHQAMTSTRGGAAAFAQYRAGQLTYTGIGNIGASLINAERARGLASHPGIVGVQYRKSQSFDYQPVGAHRLILYSDGLQSRWNLQDYPGLVHRHPAVIASILHRDFCRGRDDVTVLVLNLEDPHE
ncbi:ATP-binding protein [Pseudomonas sp. DTU_2021_1001937_2_SI_NGA_ILE_001]|uniref:ATP-binding protein n=1 Tax=Pseudomonas sp. DTU_2021_1001937_2_SI_NGA_ILE_001 TaxID=3077589 RepID=UPI0028FC3014|nr:ATP-binding protein [Pseudomonas sp. DTU_2021_1001937_2_SI_NGA_ILE_001]WNW14212.1 ATP-binding protein [Pseudomonas sp. DTU_2021_1001937_2_SI_NGA_ILE_001]